MLLPRLSSAGGCCSMRSLSFASAMKFANPLRANCSASLSSYLFALFASLIVERSIGIVPLLIGRWM